MIDRRQARAVYRQIADVYADQIRTGTLGPGDKLPSVDLLMRTYDVARATAQRALAELRAAGLIDTDNGRVSRVRPLKVRETVWLQPNSVVTWRMPTTGEAEALEIPVGVPVAVVELRGVGRRMYPGDRYELRVPGAPSAR